jgi:hypothetical protein
MCHLCDLLAQPSSFFFILHLRSRVYTLQSIPSSLLIRSLAHLRSSTPALECCWTSAHPPPLSSVSRLPPLFHLRYQYTLPPHGAARLSKQKLCIGCSTIFYLVISLGEFLGLFSHACVFLTYGTYNADLYFVSGGFYPQTRHLRIRIQNAAHLRI